MARSPRMRGIALMESARSGTPSNDQCTGLFEAAGDGFDGFGGGDGREDDFGATELLEFGCGVLGLVVNVDVSAELGGELGFVTSRGRWRRCDSRTWPRIGPRGGRGRRFRRWRRCRRCGLRCCAGR